MSKTRATKKQAEELRLKVESVRDSDGAVVHGDWFVPCRTGAILYPYDTHVWAADCLPTYSHNRLVREFGKQMRCFEFEAEIATGCGPGDEHTLHFPAELLDEAAKVLRAKRKARRSASQRAASRRNMRALWEKRRAQAV